MSVEQRLSREPPRTRKTYEMGITRTVDKRAKQSYTARPCHKS